MRQSDGRRPAGGSDSQSRHHDQSKPCHQTPGQETSENEHKNTRKTQKIREKSGKLRTMRRMCSGPAARSAIPAVTGGRIDRGVAVFLDLVSSREGDSMMVWMPAVSLSTTAATAAPTGSAVAPLAPGVRTSTGVGGPACPGVAGSADCSVWTALASNTGGAQCFLRSATCDALSCCSTLTWMISRRTASASVLTSNLSEKAYRRHSGA